MVADTYDLSIQKAKDQDSLGYTANSRQPGVHSIRSCL
jgi:hypothetical protein